MSHIDVNKSSFYLAVILIPTMYSCWNKETFNAIIKKILFKGGYDVMDALLVFFIGVILCFLIFIFCANSESLKTSKVIKCLSKVFVYILLILFFVIAFSTGVVAIVDRISKTNVQLIINLASTVLSVLVAVGGYIYTKKKDKVQAVHAESGWRKKLLELEIEPTYSIGHLLKLNAFINPFNSDKNNVDNYVNQVIINILRQHGVPSCVQRISVNINISNFPNNIEKILESKKTSIFDYNIPDDKKKEILSPVEQNEVRRCIHALLKNDWDNITGTAM